jgi:hypothetical protein
VKKGFHVFLAAALTIGSTAAASPRRTCAPATGQGTNWFAIVPVTGAETDWNQTLLCGQGDSILCDWCLKTDIQVLTTLGWWPASFVRGGSNYALQNAAATCGNQTEATQSITWGPVIRGANYAGQFKATFTLYANPCGAPPTPPIAQWTIVVNY